MRAIKKICKNIEERTTAMSYNQGLAHQGELYTARVIIPEPIWADVPVSFRLEDIIMYWEEDGDIIARHAFDGPMRLAWDPSLIAQLETKFAHC